MLQIKHHSTHPSIMKSVACLFAALSGFVSVSALGQLPHVPKIRNPGANGFPTLIRANTAMAEYMQGQDRLNHHASILGLNIKKLNQDDTARVTEQNHIYEQKLRTQEKENQEIVAENARLGKKVVKVRQFMEKLESLTKKEQDLVRSRREQFAKMKKELVEGQRQLNNMLENIPAPSMDQEPGRQQADDASDKDASNEWQDPTNEDEDDEPASFLEISKGKGPRKSGKSPNADGQDLSVEAFLGFDPSATETEKSSEKAEPPEMDTETPSEKTDLSEMEMDLPSEKASEGNDDKVALTAAESEATSMVQSLAAELAKLHQTTAKTLSKLKDSFDEGFEAGKKRHGALLKQQRVLRDALESDKQAVAELKAEYNRVAGVRKGLDKQLSKNGAFLGHLEKMNKN